MSNVTESHEAILQNHPEFELTHDMMLGLRVSLGRVESKMWRPLTERDFKDSHKQTFPRKGGKLTPAHKMRTFEFKDYAPEVFRHVRRRFGIDPSDYTLCLCGNMQFLEFISNSKSGEFFFYSHDGKYMIKTISKAEAHFLLGVLPKYLNHLMRYPDSLLTRFFGLHKVAPSGKGFSYFLVMGSVFFTDLMLHRIFDLKGSTQGRKAKKKDTEQALCVYKDLDFLEQKQKVRVSKDIEEKLNAQIKADTQLLESCNVMDYSMLVGIHDSSPSDDDEFDDDEDEDEDVGGETERGGELQATSEEDAKGNTESPVIEPSTTSHSRSSSGHPGSSGDHKDKLDSDDQVKAPARKKNGRTMSMPSALVSPEVMRMAKQQNRQRQSTMMQQQQSTQNGQAPVRGSVWRTRQSIASRQSIVQGHKAKGRRVSVVPAKVLSQLALPDANHEEAKRMSKQTLNSGKGQDGLLLQPVNPLFSQDRGGLKSEDGKQTYFFGVIDFLIEFGAKKRFENVFKGLKYDVNTISAVSPSKYASRFQNFMKAAIVAPDPPVEAVAYPPQRNEPADVDRGPRPTSYDV